MKENQYENNENYFDSINNLNENNMNNEKNVISLNHTLTSSSSSELSSRSQSPSSQVNEKSSDSIDEILNKETNEYTQSGYQISNNKCNMGKLKHSTPLISKNFRFQKVNNIEKAKLGDINSKILKNEYETYSPFFNVENNYFMSNHKLNHASINQVFNKISKKSTDFNTDETNITFSNQSQLNSKPLNVCSVCGDRASGKHYGVLSCDGCRGFFKRSIRGNMEYVCKESNSCIIDVSRRNQCQACRLKKCLEVKMNRDAVQHQRPPRSHQIRRDLIINNVSSSPIFDSNSKSNFVTRNELRSQHQLPINTQSNSVFGPRFAPYNISNLRNNYLASAVVESKKNSTASSHDSLENNNLIPTENSKISTESFQWNAYNLSYLNSSGMESLNNTNNQQTPQQDLLSSILLKQSFYSGNNLLLNNSFKNIGSIFSPKKTLFPSNISTTNTSNLSSGYNTFDENISPQTHHQNKQSFSSDSISSSNENIIFENSIENNKKNLGSLAHIMNWVKTTPTTENLIDLTVRLLFSVIKWAKRNRNLNLLSEVDQNLLISENLSQLFILQMAESKTTLNELMLLIDHEKNEDENLKNILERFQIDRVDPMEFYLLKSISLFKSDNKNILEKNKIEIIQEECFSSLFNYNKINYPNCPRFGRLLMLYADLRKYNLKFVTDFLFKTALRNNNLEKIIKEANKGINNDNI